MTRLTPARRTLAFALPPLPALALALALPRLETLECTAGREIGAQPPSSPSHSPPHLRQVGFESFDSYSSPPHLRPPHDTTLPRLPPAQTLLAAWRCHPGSTGPGTTDRPDVMGGLMHP